MTNHFDIETLEQRRLLSITWVNRGKGDHFNQYYGDQIATARAIVDAAIADWNRAIPGAKAKLTISAAPLNNAAHGGTLGATLGTTIRLDRDASGAGWYFDRDLVDNTDYADRSGLSQLVGGPRQNIDFYSVVLHEIGHALGFSDAKSPFHSGRLRDPNHANTTSDLMTPEIGAGTRRFLSPYDVQHTKTWTSATKAAAFSASATTGAPQLVVGWTDFYPSRKYSVYRSTRPGADHKRAGATLVATTKAGVTSFLDPTAESGRTYYYFVAPVGTAIKKEATAAGSSDASASLSVQATTTEPRVRVSWTPVQGARYYAVFVSTDPAIDDPTLAAVVPASVTTWTDPASFNGSYLYRVKAVFSPDGTGAGVAFPSPATGRAPGSTGSQAFSVAIGSSGLPEVKWFNANSNVGTKGVRSYRLYRAVDTGSTNRVVAGATVVIGGLDTDVDLYGNVSSIFADATAQPGVSYRYWMVGVIPGKKGSPEFEVPIGYSVVATLPASPTGAEAGTVRVVHNGSPDAGPLTIGWDPVPGARGYIVHVGTTDKAYSDGLYSFSVTGTTVQWDRPGRRRFWVTALVNDQSVLVGSVIGWNANATSPPDATGITVGIDWRNPTPVFTDIFRTTSPDDLGSGPVEFIRRVGGSPMFLDTTAVPGVTYYYWTTSYFGGDTWTVWGYGPVTRPA